MGNWSVSIKNSGIVVFLAQNEVSRDVTTTGAGGVAV